MFKSVVPILLSLFLINTAWANEPYVDEKLLDRIDKKYKIFAKKRFLFLQQMLDEVRDKDDLAKLEAVNRFFNEVKYSSDLKVYNKSDYWATPWEFLGKDKGDCEDYVISKYFALKYLGIAPEKLFFTYVRSTKFKAPHMVLTYFKTPKSEPLILDNNNRKIFPASKRKDLIPIYHFNGEVLKTGEKQKTHKKWDELQLNMQRKKI
ncbi:MAG: transglutaminase-like cysteine peptidase [Sulfurimonas sp.]|uniref:transglutaminase-like cysteine peptidase n=1 Tax=Sulfurimonas sp. TaxID=2022749 RepID=UPI002615C7BE|nr:transglutaminase-like cysteine peptidase [Sulfurimonas sp.]MCW8894570.1 transglutaminase-like cysteine peptidase [Sulfurimonas sp.]MCW8953776.1 transglutaminase-like cysteine peptidase [Sulfurimonas sp.]MCW9067522.1 transglutaminase-like cysteine peptidase [Sulfurimonas sp.]